ncbi:MAG: hypothetical protein ACK4OJ_12010 [Brevundimonas sp.]
MRRQGLRRLERRAIRRRLLHQKALAPKIVFNLMRMVMMRDAHQFLDYARQADEQIANLFDLARIGHGQASSVPGSSKEVLSPASAQHGHGERAAMCCATPAAASDSIQASGAVDVVDYANQFLLRVAASLGLTAEQLSVDPPATYSSARDAISLGFRLEAERRP